MKKSELKQIIREEIRKLLSEAPKKYRGYKRITKNVSAIATMKDGEKIKISTIIIDLPEDKSGEILIWAETDTKDMIYDYGRTDERTFEKTVSAIVSKIVDTTISVTFTEQGMQAPPWTSLHVSEKFENILYKKFIKEDGVKGMKWNDKDKETIKKYNKDKNLKTFVKKHPKSKFLDLYKKAGLK